MKEHINGTKVKASPCLLFHSVLRMKCMGIIMKKIFLSGFIGVLMLLTACGSQDSSENVAAGETSASSCTAPESFSQTETGEESSSLTTSGPAGSIQTESGTPTQTSQPKTESRTETASKTESVTRSETSVSTKPSESHPASTTTPAKATKPVKTATSAKPAETTTKPEKPAATTTTTAAFDINYWISFAKNYAKSIGLNLNSDAIYCWDNPLNANARCIYLERDIKGILDRYYNNEGVTDVWIWAEAQSDGSYDLYIGYA
ncbi:MAG: hypothetical protein QM689_07340 [Oscillospiraceae bacterium]